MPAYQQRLGNTNGGSIHQQPQVAGNAKATGMSNALPITQQ